MALSSSSWLDHRLAGHVAEQSSELVVASTVEPSLLVLVAYSSVSAEEPLAAPLDVQAVESIGGVQLDTARARGARVCSGLIMAFATCEVYWAYDGSSARLALATWSVNPKA